VVRRRCQAGQLLNDKLGGTCCTWSHANCIAPKPEKDYKTLIGNSLWGCSSQDEPVRVDVLEQEARSLSACAQDRTPGLTERLDGARRTFINSLIVKDVDAIPKAETFKPDLPCPRLHPGVCRKEMVAVPAVRDAVACLTTRLRSSKVGIGHLFAVEATRTITKTTTAYNSTNIT